MKRRRTILASVGLCLFWPFQIASAANFPQVATPEIPSRPDQLIPTGNFISGQSAPAVKYTYLGAPVGIFIYYDLDADCLPNRFSLRISQMPTHGKIAVVNATFTDDDLKSRFFGLNGYPAGPLSRCKSPNFSAKEVVYTPDAWFLGKDAVSVAVEDLGRVSVLTYGVEVLSGRDGR